MADFYRWINQADVSLFYFINKTLSTPSLNGVVVFLREAFTWIPLYLFFILFFYLNLRKHFLPIVLISILTFAITDFVSASILKPLIGRLRPCYNSELPFTVNIVAGCGGRYSMPSTHASNHFGLAALWFLIIKQLLNKSWYWLWLWAFMISFSQIYVGLHFPADILVGFLLGTGTALFCFYLFNKWTVDLNGPDGFDLLTNNR
jgi:undecaprenyl-diphosphatase